MKSLTQSSRFGPCVWFTWKNSWDTSRCTLATLSSQGHNDVITRVHDDIIVFFTAEKNNDVIMRSCVIKIMQSCK